MTEPSKRDLIIAEARRIASEPDPVPVPAAAHVMGYAPRWRRAPAPKVGFYDTQEWAELRYRALKLHGGLCQCCGSRPADGNPLQVDHIKPRSRFPELEHDLENLQVLCKWCNQGKGAWDQTDWRHR